MSAEDAAEERGILDGMAPLLDAHLSGHDGRAKELVDALRRESGPFTRLFKNWLALLDLPAPAPIEFVFVPSPGQGVGGGGANGNAVVVELPEGGSVEATMTTVAHETIHVLLRPEAQAMADAATRCGARLDKTTIGEGLAYATAPGLFAYGGARRLEASATHAALGTPYGGFYEVALGIRPELQRGLGRNRPDKSDFPALLDAICEAWTTRPH